MLDLVASPTQRTFGLDKQATLTKQCLECDVRFLCNGGCPKDRFASSRDGGRGPKYVCSGLKAFFDPINPAMQTRARLIKSNRAPRRIMEMYAAKEHARGGDGFCY